MNTYIITLMDQYISDKKIASLLFKRAVYHDKSCKKLAKKLTYELGADDYELRYVRSMRMFSLRLIYIRKKRDILVTYHIIPQYRSNKIPYLMKSY